MRRVHEKSIILGIGIGMILTSIAGLVYSGGENSGQTEKLSRDEIIRLAKSYGLVEPVHLIEDETSAAGTTGDTAADNTSRTGAGTGENVDTSTDTNNDTNNDTNADSNTQTLERNISVIIDQGFDTREVIDLLFETGIISDKEKFETVMQTYNASDRIKAGKYAFRKNDDYDYVIKTICNIK